ncbi:hypothetical protein K458DRAFT_394271 [Lentithecium fluviatile CBS 122367]|uniref:Uncharacterized protein n=1 Tax=Lentithecium fluviatile CBS 122367 TaxID=1168545 RepID=A0A6G1IMA2_9PLEO|nr:hypothetical protein K458DRAFT_394271 [Lentithecium fluviatile CBS 122367]
MAANDSSTTGIMSFARKNLITFRAGSDPDQREFAESQDRIIDMLTNDPDAMQLYLHFIHTNDVPTKVTEKAVALSSEQVRQRYMELAQVYVCAEKLQDVRTKNAVVR